MKILEVKSWKNVNSQIQVWPKVAKHPFWRQILGFSTSNSLIFCAKSDIFCKKWPKNGKKGDFWHFWPNLGFLLKKGKMAKWPIFGFWGHFAKSAYYSRSKFWVFTKMTILAKNDKKGWFWRKVAILAFWSQNRGHFWDFFVHFFAQSVHPVLDQKLWLFPYVRNVCKTGWKKSVSKNKNGHQNRRFFWHFLDNTLFFAMGNLWNSPFIWSVLWKNVKMVDFEVHRNVKNDGFGTFWQIVKSANQNEPKSEKVSSYGTEIPLFVTPFFGHFGANFGVFLGCPKKCHFLAKKWHFWVSWKSKIWQIWGYFGALGGIGP